MACDVNRARGDASVGNKWIVKTYHFINDRFHIKVGRRAKPLCKLWPLSHIGHQHTHTQRDGPQIAPRPVAQDGHQRGLGQRLPVHHLTTKPAGDVVCGIAVRGTAGLHDRPDDFVKLLCNRHHPGGIPRAGGGVVLFHPRQQLRLQLRWPTQPCALSTHGKHGADVVHGIQRHAPAQLRHQLGCNALEDRDERRQRVPTQVPLNHGSVTAVRLTI